MIKPQVITKKKKIKLVPKTFLTHDLWISLTQERRAYIKAILNIKPDSDPQVIDERVISDGVSQGALNELFKPSLVRSYIDSKTKKWNILWAEFLEEVDMGIIRKREIHELGELKKREDNGKLYTQTMQDRLAELKEKYDPKPKETKKVDKSKDKETKKKK